VAEQPAVVAVLRARPAEAAVPMVALKAVEVAAARRVQPVVVAAAVVVVALRAEPSVVAAVRHSPAGAAQTGAMVLRHPVAYRACYRLPNILARGSIA